ncbi:MAG: hypothetical protein ACRDS0_16085 [Pseudonocardiaceae bacterium]
MTREYQELLAELALLNRDSVEPYWNGVRWHASFKDFWPRQTDRSLAGQVRGAA